MTSILLTLGLLLLPTAAQPPSSPKITVMRTSSGQYDILVDGEVFFPGSKRNVTLHHHDDLKPQKTVLSSGSDPLGKHTRYDTTYASSGTTTTMVATARVYDQHIVFSQSFPTGANNTANGDRDTTLSTFPSFAVEDSHVTGERGYLQCTGDMVGSGYQVGKWGDDCQWYQGHGAAGRLSKSNASLRRLFSFLQRHGSEPKVHAQPAG